MTALDALRPKSLFARNALLLAALLVIGQLGAAWLVRQMVLKPRIERLADGTAQTVHALHEGLQALPPTQRDGFVRAFNQRAGDAGSNDTTASSMQRGFIAALASRVAADGAQVDRRREPGGGLAVTLRIDGQAHRLVLPGVLPARDFSNAWLATSLVAAVLAVVGAVVIQRWLNRPLQRVVDAAGSLSRGATPPPLPEDGPVETATLSRSFNRLAAGLAQADRDRALMLAGVSHDLRTPMTKLRLGVEIIGATHEPELMASMARSIDEMDAVVGQFLDFARVGTDEPRVTTHLDALARELVRAAADHGRDIRFEEGHPPPVPLQPNAMRRALGNLVENAFRHGEAPVVLRTGSCDGRVWIEIADHGVGIPAGEVESMKQPFRRAAQARSGHAGAGLGLAIVERVARTHDGGLELLPTEAGRREGEGLRARLSLPLPH